MHAKTLIEILDSGEFISEYRVEIREVVEHCAELEANRDELKQLLKRFVSLVEDSPQLRIYELWRSLAAEARAALAKEGEWQ